MDESGGSYTLANMTCHILPGVQAREYVVKPVSRLFGWMDLLLWMTMLHFMRVHYFKYAGSLALVWLLMKRKTVRQESILAIRDVGIQVKTVYWGGSSVSRFINRSTIEGVIINEAISFWQIKSYMAILVKDEEKMVVVFEHLLPKIDPVLLRVYHGINTILYTQRNNEDKNNFYTY
ncbi:hypothetical protein INT47_008340 [Mucor saturninus]|uniref:Phosphatidylinositol N-acetylglucosaminyltransferase subunit H conserved domain-containing protein n=1 Tax=Mucor saturninus TaxID=64648 RepID=A0A8H7V465_9FUNG|nr:hypothetical protein INT47_008340 [Mucor saturninus]